MDEKKSTQQQIDELKAEMERIKPYLGVILNKPESRKNIKALLEQTEGLYVEIAHRLRTSLHYYQAKEDGDLPEDFLPAPVILRPDQIERLQVVIRELQEILK